MKFIPASILAAAFLLTSCGGGSAVSKFKADMTEATPEPDNRAQEIAGTEELPDLGTPEDTVDIAEPDEFVPCEPGTGCFLDPCQDGSDCLSGFCVDHMGDLVCTVPCVEECPDGWECKQLLAFEPDVVFACTSPFSHLCRPCKSNDDCESANGVEDVCLSFGQGEGYCGGDCSGEGACPEGFTCADASTIDGATLSQCLPDAGECPCSAASIKLGLSTSCEAQNEWGVCPGLRLCTEEGLTECDAPLPAEEVCNGVDDDCDGDVDVAVCADDNPCTEDSCDPASGCIFEPLTGTDCTDEDVCTLADHCDAGVCVGTVIDCDDSDVCTDDSCDPAGGCNYEHNSAPCDDEDPCTVADACAGGSCQGFAVACDCVNDEDCAALEDGDVCNGTLFCDTSLVPHQCALVADSSIECEEPAGLGAECLEALCHPVTGDCSLAPANDGGACEDGDACTLGDSCLDGACLGGAAANCNDGNPCTDDACAPEAGCVYEDNAEPCEDGDVCSVADICGGGECLSGKPLDCDDGNVCTDDSCHPNIGCVQENNEAACDDLNSCTTNDQCLGGQCIGAGSLECDDGNPCTKDICLPEGGCAHENAAGSCSDGDPCTLNDFCLDGGCVAGESLDCNDANPCTDDVCGEEGLCVHAANDAECDDGNFCTVGDHCADGVCGIDGPLDCDDDNLCTTDSCDPAVGCGHVDNELPCSDGDACTAGEACVGGECLGGGPINCDDGNPCTDDSCDPAAGCVFNANTIPCDDGNSCTTGDTCLDGWCVAGDPIACDDGNPCTKDLCLPEGGCEHENVPAACSDFDLCTINDTCVDGVCVPGAVLDCDDGNLCTADECDEETGECLHEPAEGPCDDSNPCTDEDTCLQGICLGLSLTSCDDQDVCTDDSCSPLSGCIHTHNVAPCDDADPCTTTDVCADGLCVGSGELVCVDDNVCTDDLCQPGAGCIYPFNLAACDDEDACTVTDQCLDGECVGSGALECDDGEACTENSCDADTGCVYPPISPCCGNGIVEAPEECDDGNLADGDNCDSECELETQVSCKVLLAAKPGLPSGEYFIDTDAAGPIPAQKVYCDMVTDGGGYTMVKYVDGALSGSQNTYRSYCAARGMEVFTPRTKPHAMAMKAWNGGSPPNLVNVFPKYNGAGGLSNWIGKCQGQDCSFWMSDTNSCGCTNFEPNGDNSTPYSLYRRQDGCDFGNWNDANNLMDIHGWVVCSTNDK